MNFKSLVAQLANRINQPHVIETYMRKVFASGVEWQKKQSPWISVKERLPEENKGAFFIVEWKDHHKGYFVGIYEGNDCWESDHRIFLPNSPIGKVTHWMPMPELPEEENDGDK